MSPLFSIVIPTRNRPEYVGDAIASALLQDFEDLECVVSDNFNAQSTVDAVARHSGDPRLQYFRTPRLLSMLDHWEFASSKARGEIIVMLADRKVLCQGALRRIHAELDRRPDLSAFSVGTQVYDDVDEHLGWRPERRRTGIYETLDLASNFLQEDLFGPRTLDPVFPKTHNGGFRKRLARRIRDKSGHLFNKPGVTTPDYSAFFAICAIESAVLHLCDRLILTQGERTSNGRLFGAGATDAYLKDLVGHDSYKRVPFKEPFIYNLLMMDYLVVREALMGNIESLAPEWPPYFRTLYEEYQLKVRAGVLHEEQLHRLLAEWSKACRETLGQEAVHAIMESSELDKRKRRHSLDPLAHLRDFVNHRFSHIDAVNRLMKYRFPSVLRAAGFTREKLSTRAEHQRTPSADLTEPRSQERAGQ